MLNFSGTYTDHYQLSMALVYFKKGYAEQEAEFDYFFRKLPFDGGYAVFAGLENLLDILEGLSFNKSDLAFLRKKGFPDDFLSYLENFKFKGDIKSTAEGDVVFPARPILTVHGSLIETQLIETLLLNILNFQTLIATKASRMRLVAGNRSLVDFGLRRAQGPGGYYASRAALIGGFNATSNVVAGKDFGIPVSGTMAHSFIQRYDDELTAFRDFAEVHSDTCVLLVDTYDTLKSGLPNAIRVGKEMKDRGAQLKGIRLDSGDLAYLSKECRRELDKAGLQEVKIAVSNQLDEYVIKSLLEQGAPVDLFGVGTSLVTGQPDAALDGVYKLGFANGNPLIKLSENPAKTTLPGRKQVYRLSDNNNNWIGADVVTLSDQDPSDVMYHPFDPGKSMMIADYQKEAVLDLMMERGKRVKKKMDPQEIAAFSRERQELLPMEYKRFRNPHVYKVGISQELKLLRDRLIQERTSTKK